MNFMSSAASTDRMVICMTASSDDNDDQRTLGEVQDLCVQQYGAHCADDVPRPWHNPPWHVHRQTNVQRPRIALPVLGKGPRYQGPSSVFAHNSGILFAVARHDPHFRLIDCKADVARDSNDRFFGHSGMHQNTHTGISPSGL
jgi:hypothetical protein